MDKGRSACVVAAVLGVAVSSVGMAASPKTPGRGGTATAPGTTIEVPRQAPTIQAAVDRAVPGTLILVAPGVFRESVLVTRPDVVIRGVDRNRTILDGQFRRPLGIDVRANGVALENLTARNFTQNGFFWQHVDGYRGSYLTASRDREYGLYAVDSQHGQFDHSYASGSGDSGFYIGACGPCHAVAPVLDRIADERDLKLVKVNIDEEQALAQRFGVMSIPMMVLFDKGEPQASAVGAMPKGMLERALGLADDEAA